MPQAGFCDPALWNLDEPQVRVAVRRFPSADPLGVLRADQHGAVRERREGSHQPPSGSRLGPAPWLARVREHENPGPVRRRLSLTRGGVHQFTGLRATITCDAPKVRTNGTRSHVDAIRLKSGIERAMNRG